VPHGQLDDVLMERFGAGELPWSISEPVGKAREEHAGLLEEGQETQRARRSGPVDFQGAFSVKRGDEPIDGEAVEHSWLVPEEEPVPGVGVAGRGLDRVQAGHGGDGVDHVLGDPVPAVEVGVKVVELIAGDSGCERVDAVFQAHAGDCVLVQGMRLGDLAGAAFVVLAVHERPVVDLGVVGENEAAFACGEGFGPVHAERGRVTERTDFAASGARTVRVGAVFEQQEVVAVSERAKGGGVGGSAPHVGDSDGSGAVRDSRGDIRGVEVPVRVTFGENGCGAQVQERRDGREERVRRDDDFHAGSDARCSVHRVQGCSS
jgi:hypothetical protein